jgi:hypothetical protein
MAYRLHCPGSFYEIGLGTLPSTKKMNNPSGGICQKFLVEYPSRERWLSEAEALLQSDGLKLYTDLSLFEGSVGSEVSSDELFSRNPSPLFFRLKSSHFGLF